MWLDGELVGGLDILKEMHENGELVTTLPVKQSLNTRLKYIIHSHKVYHSTTRMNLYFSSNMIDLGFTLLRLKPEIFSDHVVYERKSV